MASYTLHIQYVDRPAEIKTFAQPRVSVGREGADISLFDNQVSGQHGEFVLADTGLQYIDVGSTNGSFTLQGQRIAKLDMLTGTSVRLGNSVLTLKSLDIGRVPQKGGTVIAGAGLPGVPSSLPGHTPPGAGDLAFAETGYMPQVDPTSLAGGKGVEPTMTGEPEIMATMPAPAHVPANANANANAGAGAGAGAGHSPAGQADAQGGALAPAAPSIADQLGKVNAALSERGIGSDEVGGALAGAWRLHQAELVPAAILVGGVTIPATLLEILFGLIPKVGGALVGIVNLAQALAIGFVVTPAITQLLLNRHAGQPVEWMATLQARKADMKSIAPNFLVAGLIAGVGALFLVVPGIILGCFIGPIYFAEQKRMIDITKRNVELAMKDPVAVVVKIFTAALIVGLCLFLPTWLLGKIWVGLGLLVGALLETLAFPFALATSIYLYFQVRQKHEGGDPVAASRPNIALPGPGVAVEAATPPG